MSLQWDLANQFPYPSSQHIRQSIPQQCVPQFLARDLKLIGYFLNLNIGASRLLLVELVCFQYLKQLNIGVALLSPTALFAEQLCQSIFLLNYIVLDEYLCAIDKFIVILLLTVKLFIFLFFLCFFLLFLFNNYGIRLLSLYHTQQLRCCRRRCDKWLFLYYSRHKL